MTREEKPRNDCRRDDDCNAFCSTDSVPTCKELKIINKTQCVCRYYQDKCEYGVDGEEIFLDSGALAEVGGK